MSNWRQEFFDQINCQGVINYAGDGDLTVNVQLKGYDMQNNVDVIYWAAAPATRGMSFSGSGMPYPSPDVAYDQSPNNGSVKMNGGNFTIKLKAPNSYYIGLGSLLVEPIVHVKVCGDNTVHHIPLNNAIPYRTLTYPAPPSKNPRISPMFYNNCNLPVRSQEQILKDSAYRADKLVEDNFWGLRPPR